MVVVGVGSALAITALAEDANYRFVNIPHFYLDSYEYRGYGSDTQIKVQFWRMQTGEEKTYTDDAATYDKENDRYVTSDDTDEEKTQAVQYANWGYGCSITPNTPLSDAYRAKKVYIYANRDGRGAYDVWFCEGTIDLGSLLDAFIDDETRLMSSELYVNESVLNLPNFSTEEKDDDSELVGDFYYYSWRYYIGDTKPFERYVNYSSGTDALRSGMSVRDMYVEDAPARTYTISYTTFDDLDEPVNLDDDHPYAEVTLTKSSTGMFWFSQDSVMLPIPKNTEWDAAYKTYVGILVNGTQTRYEYMSFDNTYADLSGMNFASMDYSIKVFSVSDKLTPIEANGYMAHCTPLAVRIKYDYADAHAAFKYSKNEKPNDANEQAAIEEDAYNDYDNDDTYISTYNWHGVNPEMDSLSEFFGRGVYLAGDASEQNYYDNKAPMYSNDGDDETPDEDREYLPVMGWMMEENENKKWGFGYNTEDTGDDQVQISIGELFYSLSQPTGTYDNDDTDKVEIARQNAVGKFTFNNQSGFYEYTFLVEPDLPVVTYKAVYLDADGNVVKDDGVERAVDLSDEKYGDKYKTKSYGSGTTVTVEDKLTASDFPGYTLFNGWEIDTDSLPDGKTVNDIAGRVYEQKKDKDGNLIEGEYTDNVKSFSMPSFGVVLRGELVPRVYTLTYKTNKEQYGLSVEPSKPQNSLKKDAVTQTFTIADCTLYKNQEPIHGNPDNPDQITGWTDYYLYTFPSRTCTAQDGEGNDLYYLRGWAKESDSTTETTTVKLTDLTKTDYEVYAIWENTVTYQPGKANGTNVPGTDVVDKTVTNGTHTIRTSCPFTAPTGFHFKGWELVSPTGKDYPGKFETQGSSNLIASGNQITVKDNVTYKAIWEGDKHAVTYTLTGDNQPSVTLPATAQIPYTDDYTVAGKLTATGYTFDGWDVKTGDVPDADITKDADGNAKSFKMPNNAVTLQGTFTENEYTLQYVENAPAGATVSNMPAQLTVSPILYTALKDDDYTLSDKVPTAPGYTFAGWKINETEDVIQAGNTIAFGYFDNDGKTATATAQWTLNVYKLEYKTGDVNAEMPADASNLTYAQVGGGEYTLSDTVPAAKGYTFEGWKLNVTEGNKPKGAAIPYENFDNSTFTATATAQWTENEYTLVYDTGDVTAAAGTMPEPITDSGILYTTVKDGNYTLSSAEPSAPGYTFEGWKLNVTDGNKRASDKVPFENFDNDGKTATATAQWTENKYTVTYQHNTEGTSLTDKVFDDLTYGSSHTVWDNTGEGAFIYAGHTFDGWELVSPASGYAVTGTITVNDNVTYKAKWTVNNYTLQYDKGIVSALSASSPALPGTRDDIIWVDFRANGVTVEQTKLQADGYTFLGWKITNTSSDPHVEKTYSADDFGKATFDGTVQEALFNSERVATAVAQWAENTYELVYDVNAPTGATVTSSTVPVTETKTYTELTGGRLQPAPGGIVPAVKSHTFDGWKIKEDAAVTFDKNNSGGVTVPLNTFVQVDDTTTYRATAQAQWTLVENPVTYTLTKPDDATDITYTAPATVNHAWDEEVDVVAVPAAGTDYDSEKYSFEGWTTDDVTVSGGKFTMPDQPVAFEGTFTYKEYTVTYQISGETPVGVTIEQYPSGTKFHKGDSVTMLNKGIGDVDGYTFSGWSPYADDFAMPGDDLELTAFFTAHTPSVIYLDVNGAPFTTPDALKSTPHDYHTTVEMASASLIPDIEGKTKATEWKLVDGIDASEIHDRTFSMPDNDVTFQATYTDNKYTVTYQPNVPGGSQDNKVYENISYGSSHTVWDNTGDGAFTWFGHTFAGWELVSPAGYATTGTIEVKDNVTYKAVWNTDYYTLKYDKGVVSALSASSPALPAKDDTVTLAKLRANSVTVSKIKLQAEGYTFKGWKITNSDDETKTKTYDADQFDAAEFDGTVYEALFDSSRTATAVAQWEAVTPVVPVYKVHYQYEGVVPDGVSAAPGNVDAQYDTTVTVADVPTAPQGYVFAGWNFADGTDPVPANESSEVTDSSITFTRVTSFTMPASDVTLVGKFKAKPTPPVPDPTYTVTYKVTSTDPAATAYTLPIDDAAYTEGDTVTVKDVLRVDGYNFKGWTYNGKDYGKDDTFAMPAEDVELIGEFEPNYTVKYDCNTATFSDLTGLENGPSAETWRKSSFTNNKHALTTQVPTSDNFRFVCWSKTKNYVYENRVTELALSDFGSDRTCTVYAIWVAKLDVTYTCGIDEDDPAWKNNQIDTTHVFEIDEYTLNYRVRSNEELEHPFVFPGYEITKWKVTEGWENIQFPSQPSGGSTGTAAAPVYRRSGNGDEEHFLMINTLVILHGNITVKAVWEPISSGTELTVTYNSNGGTGAVPVDSNKYTANDTPTVLAKGDSLVKDGAEFVEWNTSANGSGKGYQAGQQLDPMTANVTLYAIWKPDVAFIVEYDGNGHTAGTVPTDNSRYAAGSTAAVKSKEDLERTGCTFKEWNTQSNGSGTGYKGDGTDTIQINGNVKLYAIWVDPNGNIVSPGTGESNLPMLIACNMALLSMLAGGLVLTKRKKAEMQQTVC